MAWAPGARRWPEGRNLWAGTDLGLARYDGQRWHSHADALPHDFVTALAAGRDGVVWVASLEGGVADPEHGVSRFDGQQWSHFTTDDGLPDQWVNDLAVDDDGTVWAATGAGLARFEGDEHSDMREHPPRHADR